VADETDPALTVRLDRIKKLTDELIRVQDTCDEAKDIAAKIQREVDSARAALKFPKPGT
jgi:hypothetical protein